MEETLKIRSVTLSGDGIANLENGKTVFVEGALHNEVVEVDIIKEKKKFAQARIRKILEASEDRIEPECVHAARCGGCSFWHTRSHFKLKQEAAYQTISRISKIPLPAFEALMEEEVPDKEWRVRATYHWDGVRLGFHAKKTKEVASVYECLVVAPQIKHAVLLAHDALRSSRTQKADVRFEVDGDNAYITTKSFALKKLADQDGISGLKIQDKFLGDREKVSIDLQYDGKTHQVNISPGQFRQANTFVNEHIGNFVASHIPKGSEVSEYFCGYGNLTFRYLAQTRTTFAFEASSESIAIAGTLATKFKCSNLNLARVDLFKKVPKISPIAVLDPPRAGAQIVCEALAAEKKCSKVIYVSCDPATLARDLSILVEGAFKVKTLLFADMFPRTSHIETLVILER